ncbi:MAG: substrate-binding domain-containing protein [Pseudomonadota bacterium]
MKFAGTLAGALIALTAVTAHADEKTVAGIVFSQLEYFRAFQTGMESAATAASGAVLMGNSDAKPEKEASLIDTYISSGVGAIVISPVSDKGSVAALQRAADAGIKVVLYNSPLAADFPVASIVSSDKDIGESTGKEAAKFITEKLGGKANVALLGFKSLLPEQSDGRTNGFLAPVQAAGDIKIVAQQDGWTPEKAVAVASDILTANPDINIIYAANEGGTVGAVQAVKQAGLQGKVFVFGTDGSEQLVNFIKEENPVLLATTAQQPVEIGKAAYEAARKAIAGEPVEKVVAVPVLPLSISDPAGLDAYLAAIAAYK